MGDDFYTPPTPESGAADGDAVDYVQVGAADAAPQGDGDAEMQQAGGDADMQDAADDEEQAKPPTPELTPKQKAALKAEQKKKEAQERKAAKEREARERAEAKAQKLREEAEAKIAELREELDEQDGLAAEAQKSRIEEEAAAERAQGRFAEAKRRKEAAAHAINAAREEQSKSHRSILAMYDTLRQKAQSEEAALDAAIYQKRAEVRKSELEAEKLVRERECLEAETEAAVANAEAACRHHQVELQQHEADHAEKSAKLHKDTESKLSKLEKEIAAALKDTAKERERLRESDSALAKVRADAEAAEVSKLGAQLQAVAALSVQVRDKTIECTQAEKEACEKRMALGSLLQVRAEKDIAITAAASQMRGEISTLGAQLQSMQPEGAEADELRAALAAQQAELASLKIKQKAAAHARDTAVQNMAAAELAGRVAALDANAGLHDEAAEARDLAEEGLRKAAGEAAKVQGQITAARAQQEKARKEAQAVRHLLVAAQHKLRDCKAELSAVSGSKRKRSE
eukprot:TRINITY_DN14267_c0_g1_i1.p1 TRINITY_DN14267_c0_g1~~TRINITY_DN14267_c0_g1_i1.p1  ORF type:complete len:517 (+),score=247.93 TRINITY_DN14267_c0_g1_i1:96-1646(+)